MLLIWTTLKKLDLKRHAVSSFFLLAARLEEISNVPNKSTHVVQNPKGGWDIKQSNGQRSSGHFDTKQDAVNRALELSKNQETELVVHNKDGKTGSKDSHGKDPSPPKG